MISPDIRLYANIYNLHIISVFEQTNSAEGKMLRPTEIADCITGYSLTGIRAYDEGKME